MFRVVVKNRCLGFAGAGLVALLGLGGCEAIYAPLVLPLVVFPPSLPGARVPEPIEAVKPVAGEALFHRIYYWEIDTRPDSPDILPRAFPSPRSYNNATLENGEALLKALDTTNPDQPSPYVRKDVRLTYSDGSSGQYIVLGVPTANGWLGNPEARPAFTGIRQRWPRMTASTRLNHAATDEGALTGLAIYRDAAHYSVCGLTYKEGKAYGVMINRKGEGDPAEGIEAGRIYIKARQVETLGIGYEVNGGKLSCFVAADKARLATFGNIDAEFLNQNVAVNPGALVGFYAYSPKP